mmetsp:Transcript_2286/g.15207  ORF Transcript_2286/g.15207 Transcript_2286/m.15207 type:complete len:212 (+) Transcript_2286:557-1192(+)
MMPRQSSRSVDRCIVEGKILRRAPKHSSIRPRRGNVTRAWCCSVAFRDGRKDHRVRIRHAPSYTHASWMSRMADESTMFLTMNLLMALSFGTMMAEDSHRTRFTCTFRFAIVRRLSAQDRSFTVSVRSAFFGTFRSISRWGCRASDAVVSSHHFLPWDRLFSFCYPSFSCLVSCYVSPRSCDHHVPPSSDPRTCPLPCLFLPLLRRFLVMV